MFTLLYRFLSVSDCFQQVLEEEAVEVVVSLWRQVIFESLAYGEGLLTEKMLIDS